MSDAIALFRPRRSEALLPFLDLDDDNDESDGIYAEQLEDGSYLLHTFQPYDLFAESPAEARAWLTQFGDAFRDVHDDPRGVLFFPDALEPEAHTYTQVIAEVGDRGFFLPPAAEVSSFEIGKLFEGVQEQLMASLVRSIEDAGAEEHEATKPDEPATERGTSAKGK